MLSDGMLEWPLEAGFKSELIPTDLHVKMPKFRAEINMFTAWYNTVLVSIAKLLKIVWGVIFKKKI